LDSFLLESSRSKHKLAVVRECLEGFVSQYLAAMLADDASKAPSTANVKFVENAKALSIAKPGKGLWVTSTSLG
jgi:hypothetical protein